MGGVAARRDATLYVLASRLAGGEARSVVAAHVASAATAAWGSSPVSEELLAAVARSSHATTALSWPIERLVKMFAEVAELDAQL